MRLMPAARAFRQPAAGMALPLAVYSVAAVVATWPLATAPATQVVAASSGAAAPSLTAFGRTLHALTGSGDAAAPEFLLSALLVLPLHLGGANLVLCHNLVLLASLALSGLAMHACARTLGAETPGAYVAGVAWAFWPYRMGSLARLETHALYLLPLAIVALCRVVAGRRQRDAVLLGALAGLQTVAGAHGYRAVTVVMLLLLAPAVAFATGRSLRRLVPGLLLAAVVATLVVLPFPREGESAMAPRAVTPASYLRPVPGTVLHDTLWPAAPERRAVQSSRQTPRMPPLFPGVVVVMLAAVGLAWRDAPGRALVPGLVVVAVAGFVLSSGVAPLRAIHDGAAARFPVLVMTALALLAAAGGTRVSRYRGALAWGLAALAFVEYLAVPVPLAPAAYP
ncbi:MAG TPA: hypothetical protein VF198_09795 [Vicinamibacterales bacterium]